MGNLTLHNTDNYSAMLLDSIVTKLYEVDIAPEDALDDIVALDPQTELGKAMTEVMVDIANLNLFDYYIGYSRKGNTIKLHMAGDAPSNSMRDLVTQIEQSIETTPEEDEGSYIKATLRRETLEDDSKWILELTIFSLNPDEFGDASVETDIDGDVAVQNDQADIEQPAGPAGVGQTIPEE